MKGKVSYVTDTLRGNFHRTWANVDVGLMGREWGRNRSSSSGTCLLALRPAGLGSSALRGVETGSLPSPKACGAEDGMRVCVPLRAHLQGVPDWVSQLQSRSVFASLCFTHLPGREVRLPRRGLCCLPHRRTECGAHRWT